MCIRDRSGLVPRPFSATLLTSLGHLLPKEVADGPEHVADGVSGGADADNGLGVVGRGFGWALEHVAYSAEHVADGVSGGADADNGLGVGSAALCAAAPRPA